MKQKSTAGTCGALRSWCAIVLLLVTSPAARATIGLRVQTCRVWFEGGRVEGDFVMTTAEARALQKVFDSHRLEPAQKVARGAKIWRKARLRSLGWSRRQRFKEHRDVGWMPRPENSPIDLVKRLPKLKDTAFGLMADVWELETRIRWFEGWAFAPELSETYATIPSRQALTRRAEWEVAATLPPTVFVDLEAELTSELGRSDLTVDARTLLGLALVHVKLWREHRLPPGEDLVTLPQR